MSLDIKRFLRIVYLKIVRINDSPHKIAGGFAIGVFLGILPGAGPIASIVLAYVFRVNRAAALAGSLLTNFWFSIVAFALAIKIGALLTQNRWQEIYAQAKDVVDHFSWEIFRDGTTWAIFKPVLIGYAAIGLVSGIFVYGIVLGVLVVYRRRKVKRS